MYTYIQAGSEKHLLISESTSLEPAAKTFAVCASQRGQASAKEAPRTLLGDPGHLGAPLNGPLSRVPTIGIKAYWSLF